MSDIALEAYYNNIIHVMVLIDFRLVCYNLFAPKNVQCANAIADRSVKVHVCEREKMPNVKRENSITFLLCQVCRVQDIDISMKLILRDIKFSEIRGLRSDTKIIAPVCFRYFYETAFYKSHRLLKK